MASSTSRPRAMISAPSEMRCRVMPEYSMNRKVPASTSGMAIATTSPARRPIDRAQTLFRGEAAADAQADPLRAGLHHARRRHGILRLQALQDGLLVEAETGHLAGREVEIDHLVLDAQQLNLAGGRQLQ